MQREKQACLIVSATLGCNWQPKALEYKGLWSFSIAQVTRRAGCSCVLDANSNEVFTAAAACQHTCSEDHHSPRDWKGSSLGEAGHEDTMLIVLKRPRCLFTMNRVHQNITGHQHDTSGAAGLVCIFPHFLPGAESKIIRGDRQQLLKFCLSSLFSHPGA